jgi:cytochrome c553
MGTWGCLTVLLLSLAFPEARSSPASDPQTGLPTGSELNEDARENPREVFHSETLHGRRSYATNLGNLAFNSPYTLGDVARKAHMSCGTCHVNGASNPKLFIPGLSTHPGNFDTTSALFNPKTDDRVLDPLTIPSLRGARFLGPYGHDGRTASLRDFVRNVIVNEFAGSEPSPQILDAIITYIEDIDFLPNPRLGAAGTLSANQDASVERGATVFAKPFPHDPNLSCAGCHVPSEAFVDHRQHDVGSGGYYKTPTLLNADFNAPYFHDGRFDNYSQVIEHFDHAFDLHLSAQDSADLESYLRTIGDGVRPEYHLTGINVLEDINGFASVLDIAIAHHDGEVITLATRTVTGQLQDLADHYPDPTADQTADGARERGLARATLATLIKTLQRVETSSAEGRFDDAASQYLRYRGLTLAGAPVALQSAQRWSLFNPAVNATRSRPNDVVRSRN